ncbi:MAG: M28 family peptidase [Angelakisella sp.]
MNETRAFTLLKEIGFVRTAGSPEEHRAAELLIAQAAKLGVTAVLEPFDIPNAVTKTAKLEVLQPYQKSYTVTDYKCCANTDDNGLTADFYYAQGATAADLADARGKIVLVNGYLRLPAYKRMTKAGVAGFVTMSGALLDREEETDLFTRQLRTNLQTFGSLPGVNLRATDAFELVKQQASQVRLTVKSETVALQSGNVVAEIKGTKYPEEIISFGAHYDSTEFSTGVYDNGAGSVMVMELLHYFTENPPLRTVKFIWYGSEEVGLLGSHAYVKQHEEELRHHLLMINIDVGGSVLGQDLAQITGEMSLVHFTDYFMKLRGYPVEVTQSTYSSDSIPFANKGVPAVNFIREGAEGGAYIHCRNDVIDYLSPEGLDKTMRHLLDYSTQLVNAVVFPVEKKMPTEMVEAVDKYLYKKELEEAKLEHPQQ